ncbi:hypothetical protein [Paractinoplanes lichenicola]|uniref:Leucine rich repeat variant n=1 Tax=Paractinoplanes lichenicola TaxID=2802976 RepID=A0ABS1VKN6_9ACTN|nr:hypothetical protein [Actinoplanes lichenicola]MBL7254337.1 hypothetical protein [Actinoplanes lichenicola]
MRMAAAAHPDASVELLAALTTDASRKVRRIAAGRPRTPPTALRTRAADPDAATREVLAANVNTPIDVLCLLTSDKDFQVRYAAMTNPAADDRVLEACCASPHRDLRIILAQEPRLPAEIVALLTRDKVGQVREFLAERTDDPAALDILVNDPNARVRAAAAQNRLTTAGQRAQLVRDPAAPVRASLVNAMATLGWDIPEQDLLTLARDRSVNVRYWLAGLPGSTRAVYEVLAQDPDEQIATNARQWLTHPSNPAHLGDTSGLALGRFPNPAQLGRPARNINHRLWNQYMNR